MANAKDRGLALDRRTFCGSAAAALASSQLGISSMSKAADPIASLKRIDAGLLDVAYTDYGPPTGQPVILLHGWPYDIRAFDEVARDGEELPAAPLVRCALSDGSSPEQHSGDPFLNEREVATRLQVLPNHPHQPLENRPGRQHGP